MATGTNYVKPTSSSAGATLGNIQEEGGIDEQEDEFLTDEQKKFQMLLKEDEKKKKNEKEAKVMDGKSVVSGKTSTNTRSKNARAKQGTCDLWFSIYL